MEREPEPLQPGDIGFEPRSLVEALQHCWKLGVEDIRSSPEAVAAALQRKRIIERSVSNPWN